MAKKEQPRKKPKSTRAPVVRPAKPEPPRASLAPRSDANDQEFEEFVETVHTFLLQKKRSLQNSVSRELTEMRSTDGHHPADIDDLGSDAFDEATAFHVLETESQDLSQIDRALEMLEEGTYGRCEECGEHISVDRLRALPFATLCIRCKRNQEATR